MYVFLVLCAVVSASTAHFLGEFPPVVNIPWPKSLLPCESYNSTFDCSERGKSTLSEADVVCNGTISAVNLFDNKLVNFPDGFEDAIVVNASRNKFERAPRTTQLNVRIRLLDLSENSICNVEPDFRHLVSLETLRFSKNCLKNLLFLPEVCALVNLEIASNALTSLSGSLSHCTELLMLDVADNNITEISEDLFTNLTQLVSLDLSWNHVAPFPTHIFSSLRLLKELRLDGVGIESIPEGLFNNLSRLEHLSLDGNELSSVTGTSFSGLVNLIYLSISKNKLRTLQSLGDLPFLEELHLAGNQLTSLTSSSFINLPRLKFVNIDSNNLSFLPMDIFSGLNYLDTVFLRDEDAPIQLSQSIFSNTRNLQLISISVGNFQSEFLQTISHVPYVQCYSCGLTSLSTRAFEALNQTKALSIEYNRIESISDSAFQGLSHLTYLSLGGNGIDDLSVGVFSHIRHLTRLHLWENNITALPEDIFSSMSSLTELTLNQNLLTALPENIFHETNSLKRLDLSHNRLTSLPVNLFRNLSDLWELNVANNLLTSLPMYDPTCVSLKAISFEQNDFRSLERNMLNSWLFSGNKKRFVNLAHNSSKIAPQSVDWLLRSPDVKVNGHNTDCSCTTVRSEVTLLRFCVNVTCGTESSRLWMRTVNNSSELTS